MGREALLDSDQTPGEVYFQYPDHQVISYGWIRGHVQAHPFTSSLPPVSCHSLRIARGDWGLTAIGLLSDVFQGRRWSRSGGWNGSWTGYRAVFALFGLPGGGDNPRTVGLLTECRGGREIEKAPLPTQP